MGLLVFGVIIHILGNINVDIGNWMDRFRCDLQVLVSEGALNKYISALFGLN